MTHQDREQRLAAEAELLNSLAEHSSILSLTSSSEPASQYRLVFAGRGYCKNPDQPDEITTSDRHEVELRLPHSFPDRPPELRWLTPLFHPNVSSSGFLTLTDIGVEWDPALTLDVVCERLWDVARGAFVNEDRISYPSAWQWHQRIGDELGAADRRPLRDRKVDASENIIRYERKGPAARPNVNVAVAVPPAVPPEAISNPGIRFIDASEDPAIPPRGGNEGEEIWFLDD